MEITLETTSDGIILAFFTVLNVGFLALSPTERSLPLRPRDFVHVHSSVPWSLPLSPLSVLIPP
jgi:hypothetical protein